ncbi:unnamed protein product [Orchesella dallaii]|uniref:Uncharacterized protein n=1 Tax=Orchesella dallaii TaxID=48710 RepID=A0ABP1RG55_9HEXA
MMWASRSSRLKWLIVSAFFTWLFITENFQNANADVETLIDDIAKVLNRNSSRQEILKTLKQHKKEKLRLDTFAGWERWGATYSNCNADINPSLSPIEIDSKKVTHLKKGLAVLIYSDLGTPANCLYLSSDLVKQTFEMEAVNIMVAPICREFITTISGAGGGAADFRYFKGAVFYFTNSQVEPERSLHQIDGRKFDMEIEIEFTDRMGEKSTLLHVMVEPLEEAVEDLKKKMAGLKDTIETKEAHLNRLEEACLNAEKEYFELMALEIEQLNNTAYVNQFNKLNKMFHDIHEMTNAKYLALQGTLKSIQAATEQSAQNKIGIMEDVDKLKVRNQKGWARSKEQMKREKEVYEARKKKDASLRKAKLFAKKSVIIQEDLKTYEDLFAKNSIGVPGGKPAPDLKYDSPDKLVEELKSYSGILDAIETAEVHIINNKYHVIMVQLPQYQAV